ncbi:putative transposase [Streptomyces scabiei 87.22]|uniref:Putative transposase n=1 Tax=Streptomyces scabiei (strain 87.22) TaxID=680198 RepID=C9YXP9_STRSW|nr:putative transposase [Streptomyces scabiei 87.22]
MLRSQDATGIQQELWAHLTVYQALRRAMVEAVETLPGTDPDRTSFTIALETAKDQLIAAADALPEAGPGHIASALLHDLLPPRRARVNPRRVKVRSPAMPRRLTRHKFWVPPGSPASKSPCTRPPTRAPTGEATARCNFCAPPLSAPGAHVKSLASNPTGSHPTFNTPSAPPS